MMIIKNPEAQMTIPYGIKYSLFVGFLHNWLGFFFLIVTSTALVDAFPFCAAGKGMSITVSFVQTIYNKNAAIEWIK